jgi:hypothetical protein
MNATTSVAEILRAAADQIETYGWEQGRYFGPQSNDPQKCSACASGAIAAQAGAINHLASQVALAIIRQIRGKSGPEWNLPEWNDDPARTAEEVIATLRVAADAAEVPA